MEPERDPDYEWIEVVDLGKHGSTWIRGPRRPPLTGLATQSPSMIRWGDTPGRRQEQGMKLVKVEMELAVDEDATEDSLAQWLKVVLPLRGDTGQIQDVRQVHITEQQ